mmetsp:Transcript_6396/g.13218  ORF Transcript_6396/g.13218 Transcript_6396/m.13218 type:complete len:206 (-) Transcript_6396:444-1061(-)
MGHDMETHHEKKNCYDTRNCCNLYGNVLFGIRTQFLGSDKNYWFRRNDGTHTIVPRNASYEELSRTEIWILSPENASPSTHHKWCRFHFLVVDQFGVFGCRCVFCGKKIRKNQTRKNITGRRSDVSKQVGRGCNRWMHCQLPLFHRRCLGTKMAVFYSYGCHARHNTGDVGIDRRSDRVDAETGCRPQGLWGSDSRTRWDYGSRR